MFDHPFDRQFRIETARFGQRLLRLVYLARLRVGRRQVRIYKIGAKTRVDRLVKLVDRRVDMAEVELREAR
jgi:hypothetical protein